MAIGLGIGISIGGQIYYVSGGGYDPSAISYFSAVESAGGTLTDNIKAEFNAFVVREKDAGRWDKIKRLYPFLGGNINSARIDAITLAQATNQNFVDADVDTTIGLQGDGSTKYLNVNTTWPNIVSSMSNLQHGFFILGSGNDGVDQYIQGTIQTATDTWLVIRKTSSNLPVGYCDTGSTAIAPLSASSVTGLTNYSVICARYSINNAVVYVNKTPGTTATTTITKSLPTISPFIFARNLNGVASAYANLKLGGSFFAENMIESEIIAFETSYKTFINNIQAYAAAQAYFSAVTASGGTLSANVQAEFTSFVSREVEAGRWSKIKRLYPFLGGKIASAVIDAVTTNAATNNNFVDGDVNTTCGLTGDASTKTLVESGGESYNDLVSDPRQSLQYGVFYPSVLSSSISGNVFPMGTLETSPSNIYYYLRNQINGGCSSYLGPNAAASAATSYTTSTKSHIACRVSPTEAYSLIDGTQGSALTADVTSADLPTDELVYFGRNVNGVVVSSIADTLTGAFVAENLSLQDTKDFETSYQTFITNVQAYAALMDSYAGAAAAYSLRKLYSSYTGSAINVRRSSDNATQDIGFDGYVLDTASLLSFVGAGSGYVTTWYDQSGNGNNATQSTAANQPQIVSSGNVITENGKPTVSFDGSNDQMNVAYSFSNTSISHILVNSYDKDLQPSTYPHFFSGVNNNYSNRVYLVSKTNLYYYSSGSGSSLGNTTGVYGVDIDNNLNIISLSLRNSGAGYTGDFNLNGNSQIAFSNASVPLQSFTSQILGNWNTTNGNAKMNVSEFIQFSSDESTNLSGINSLINTYYNIY